MEKKKFYITTPIYYPSGTWHIGTCYTTVVCDAIADYMKMNGYDTFFLTGTDEHGQKIERKAKEIGISPKAFVDKQVSTLKDLWEKLGIRYDKFIRTTDDYHEKAVQKIFEKLYNQGDIYLSEYEGWYCTPCESFWTKTQLVDGKCPDCGRDVELTKESCYFFKLSKYREKILELFKTHPEFLEPKSRQNEMINNFLKDGLQDLAVTRTSFSWGIQVPFDPKHVIYVWIDALTNYITALGYMQEDDSLFKKYWPADIHMIGKEIVRFHSIIWPAILMALGIELPKKVYGHGWLLLDGGKISKSSGNIVDPVILSDRYGVDSVRYYLLREVPFGADGVYTNEAFLTRINVDLCNTLGNLLSRTTAMIEQNFNGILPKLNKSIISDYDLDLEKEVDSLKSKVDEAIDKLQIPEALTYIFKLCESANKYIDLTEPWKLAKDETLKEKLGNVLYHLTEVLRVVGIMLLPFIPNTAKRILADISVDVPSEFNDLIKFGYLNGGEKITKNQKALYERIKIQQELVEMDKISKAIKEKANAKKEEKKVDKMEINENVSEIVIDDFAKIQLKIGKILTAEKHPNSKKLLHFTVDTGDKVRSICSGVAKFYTPEEMVGKEVIVVTNLKTAVLGGIESEGMILFAEDEEGVYTVEPSKVLKPGSIVS
ncbi:MAG: methionine--tRNA ligase [Clostridia bacterium]|nr:methionine--tRNA ligase [Clostridia bacterium]